MPYESIFAPGLFDGSTVLVTGGGSGIGRCVVHELTHLGAHVAVVGRSADKLDRVRREVEDDGGDVSTYVCDIRDEDAVVGVVDAVVSERGRIDGLVNNAGGQYRAPLKDITTKGFEAVVRTNLTGGFVVMREVYNRTMAAHGGSIVNMIADIWHGWPHFSHSAAARGGMFTLTESAATEWAASGVRVNSVAPGSIASSGLDTYDAKDREFIRNEVTPGIPLQRFGTEAEGVGRDRLPALAGSRLRHRLVPTHRRRCTQRPSWLVGAPAGRTRHPVRGVPPVHGPRDPGRHP